MFGIVCQSKTGLHYRELGGNFTLCVACTINLTPYLGHLLAQQSKSDMKMANLQLYRAKPMTIDFSHHSRAPLNNKIYFAESPQVYCFLSCHQQHCATFFTPLFE